MTSPNNDTGQLNQDVGQLLFEELEQVSGGFYVGVLAGCRQENLPT